ncbi:MAG: TadE/TadG family type IV pilus assembly protein [Ilumatobacteraceae bacterium]
MRSSTRCDRTDDRGQAVVELALSLPLVCLLLLGVVQVGLVVRDDLVVLHLAREAARAASVSAAPLAAARGALASGPPIGAAVSVRNGVGTVRVVVTATSRTRVPLVGLLVPDVALRAEVVMATEPP